jgi:hypothetical protein
VIGGGRDRVWLAGGELSFGEVSPSRLFFPGQTPAWNPAINIQVDRNFEPITAVGFVGDLTAIFRRTKTYILDSDGPDNSYNGTWPSPRLSLADLGCTGQETLALSVGGLWFQSTSGLRQLSAGGSLANVGQEVDAVASVLTIAGSVVVPQYNQVRWYSRDNSDSLVYNYDTQLWTSWSGLACKGAVFWPQSQTAVLARGDGTLLLETPGEWMDAGTPYEMRVQTSWLHAKNLGDFQRVRRFALFGPIDYGAHTLRTRVFYDERQFWDEEFQDDFMGDDPTSVRNASVWGDTSWGDNTWGDSNYLPGLVDDGLSFRDGLYRVRHRPSRQKCSVFSLEFSDQGAATAGFIPVVVALELGVKPGLDRIPTDG